MNFLELAKNRFSVRKFSDTPLEKEKLDKILEAGKIAPTAKNQQPFRIYVLQSEEALAKINALTPCIYGAKTVLLVCYHQDEAWKNPFESNIHSGEVDASIVGTHIMLEAADLGVDSVWVGYFPNSKVEQAFNLPEKEKSVFLLPLGYRADGVEPAPPHTASKEISALVKYL